MHAHCLPGIYPNNAIVGGSAPLATGAALYNRLQAQAGLVVASVGDAATGTGPVWESFNFAAMAQLKTLMDAEHRGGLPVIFFVVNNFYGMGGQTIGKPWRTNACPESAPASTLRTCMPKRSTATTRWP